MDTEALVTEFADCVAAQTRCIEEGDAETGNKYAKRYVAAFEKLRGFGSVGRDALSVLFQDERTEVRAMAAAFLLRHCEDRAKAVLKQIAQGSGLTAFGASQALRRWDEGTWALDPAPESDGSGSK